MVKGNPGQGELVFDPKDRVEFIKGFKKRKQERKEVAERKAKEKERQIRILLRKKKKEALAGSETTT